MTLHKAQSETETGQFKAIFHAILGNKGSLAPSEDGKTFLIVTIWFVTIWKAFRWWLVIGLKILEKIVRFERISYGDW